MRALRNLALAGVAGTAALLGARYWAHGESPHQVVASLRAGRGGPSGPAPTGGEPLSPPPQAPEQRVLFIGNSLTYSYGVPEKVERMAWAAGINLRADQYAQGGWFLDQHAASPEALSRIRRGGWGWVVLQEQSRLPAWEAGMIRDRMVPGARALAREVRRSSPAARLVLYVTPAWRNGDAEGAARVAAPEMATYAGMQARVNRTYEQLASDLGATLAPAGHAWARSRTVRPSLELYGDDTHPNNAGAYLVACVMFATLTGRSPVGNAFTAGLDPSTALFLQNAAERTLRERGWQYPARPI